MNTGRDLDEAGQEPDERLRGRRGTQESWAGQEVCNYTKIYYNLLQRRFAGPGLRVLGSFAQDYGLRCGG